MSKYDVIDQVAERPLTFTRPKVSIRKLETLRAKNLRLGQLVKDMFFTEKLRVGAWCVVHKWPAGPDQKTKTQIREP